MQTDLHEFENRYLQSRKTYSKRKPDLSIAPDLIQDIFKRYGLSSFENGFLWLIDPGKYKEFYQPWFNLIAETEGYIDAGNAYPFMRTAFGDCFFFEGDQLGFFSIATGVTNYLDANYYFNQTLVDDETLHGIYLFDIFTEFVKDSAPIQEKECLGFLPPLALGGEISQDNIEKVGLIEQLAFLSGTLPTSEISGYRE